MSARDTDAPKPPATTEDEPGFLGRWSRRKQAIARGETPPEPVAEPPAQARDEPPLPDPLTLGIEDDFSGFLRDKVPPALKRKAMQHLFSHAQFNVVDGLDVYMEDFNKVPNLDSASMALVKHAKAVLDPEPAPQEEAQAVAEATPPDAADLTASETRLADKPDLDAPEEDVPTGDERPA